MNILKTLRENAVYEQVSEGLIIREKDFGKIIDVISSQLEPQVIKKNAGIEFRPNMDEIDEICADNCSIHLEYMDDTDIWMAIEKGEESFHVHIQTKKAHIKTWAEKC